MVSGLDFDLSLSFDRTDVSVIADDVATDCASVVNA